MKFTKLFFAFLFSILTVLPSYGQVIEGKSARDLKVVSNYIHDGDAEAYSKTSSGWAVYNDSNSVTFQDTGDTVTLTAHGLSVGQIVSFTTITSTTGITANTQYYVVNVTANTFQVSATLGGAAIALTTDGTGTLVRARPLDGIGGTPTISLPAVTTTAVPVELGKKTFLFTHPASNVMGQGWSIPFTAPKAKVLNINISNVVGSGTFTAGTSGISGTDSDVIVYVYDVTNSRLIEPSSIRFLSNSTTFVDELRSTFQTNGDSTSYRLIIHNATANANAWTLKADVGVSPSSYVYGTPITAWAGYTPIKTNSPTVTSESYQYRRVGSNVEMKGNLIASGAGAASTFLISAPTGIVLDSSSPQSPGTVHFFDSGVSVRIGAVTQGGSNTMTFTLDSGTTAIAGNSFTVNDGLTFFFSNPVVGWDASTQMSDSADTRVVAGSMDWSGTLAVASSVETAITGYTTTQFDTHGAFNASAGTYTVPVPGIYEIKSLNIYNGGTTGSAVGAFIIRTIKGGTTNLGDFSRQDAPASTYNAAPIVTTGSSLLQLNSGDVLQLKAFQNTGVSRNLVYNSFQIKRLSGPSAISDTENISVRYGGSSSQSIANSTDTVLLFTTKLWDTHGAYNPTTGVFTAPAPGKYRITGGYNLVSATAGTGEIIVSAYKNNVAYCRLARGPISSSNPGTYGATTVDLLFGETLTLIGYQSNGATRNLTATSFDNWIAIERIK